MKVFYTLIFCFTLLLFSFSFLNAQNYLRVIDPDDWSNPISTTPQWAEWTAHGAFEEVTIITSPQGVYTEIEIFATISQGDASWAWEGQYEIIWQFQLPANAIVHDSWLWVGDEVIKADVVDYWTALETYEGIVNRNSDPSFLYELPDNRHEIRIFPLLEGESRRIKMSFLIPATWSLQHVTNDLLQGLFKSTTYTPTQVNIGMPVQETWQTPTLQMDNTLIPLTEVVQGGTGQELHYIEVSGTDFIQSNKVNLIVDAPLGGEKAFLSTYVDDGEQYYQLAYLPDWQSSFQGDPKRSLILLDYNESKSQLSKEHFIEELQTVLGAHFNSSDLINIGVHTSTGVQLLNDTWWTFNGSLLSSELTTLLENNDDSNLEQLLIGGYNWAQLNTDVQHIYLLSANDDYVYPPVADEVFLSLENTLLYEIPLSILDFQDENVSILFYNEEEYHGNEYFYQLLDGAINESTIITYRESNDLFTNILFQLYPAPDLATGIMDNYTSLENGIAYNRYELNSADFTPENQGVILQTGKYLGDFPMQINANLITADGEFYIQNYTIEPNLIHEGDSLMKEMWYGSYLKELENIATSNEDRSFIIQESINERVLTGLTAFLALEPGEGGEPCIDCLLNNGEIIWLSTDDLVDASKVSTAVTPNPATDFAMIQLMYDGPLNPKDWTAAIFDAAGRPVCDLTLLNIEAGKLEWKWSIDKDINAGMYFCKIQSAYGEEVAKIIVLPK